MDIKKLTKEVQEKRLQDKVKEIKNKKPSFQDWLMHDKTAFKITYIIGALGGLLVTLGLLGIAFIFDFDIVFKALFGLLVIWQGWNTYKVIRDHKNVDSSINDIVYRGKRDKSQYEQKRTEYEVAKFANGV